MASSVNLFKSLIRYIDAGLPLTDTTQLTNYLVQNTPETVTIVNSFLNAILNELFSLSIISKETVTAFNTWVNANPISKVKSIFLQLKPVLLTQPSIVLSDLGALIGVLDSQIALNSRVILNLSRFISNNISNISDLETRDVLLNETNKLLKNYVSMNADLTRLKTETQNRIAAG
jgi:hypothetical protein